MNTKEENKELHKALELKCKEVAKLKRIIKELQAELITMEDSMCGMD